MASVEHKNKDTSAILAAVGNLSELTPPGAKLDTPQPSTETFVGQVTQQAGRRYDAKPPTRHKPNPDATSRVERRTT